MGFVMLTGAWILALLATGAPLMAMGGSADTDADERDDAGPDSTEDDTRDAPERAGSDVYDDDGRQDTAEDDSLPTDYEFVLQSGGDHLIGGFRPGIDTLILTSDTWDFDLYDLGGDERGAALGIGTGEKNAKLHFPGLDRLPVDDIWLHVLETGRDLLRLPLRAALWPEEDEALSPTDTDALDNLPADMSEGPPLVPADPAAPDERPARS